MKKHLLLRIFLVFAGAYTVWWFALANPLNLFVPRSPKFSFQRFEEIKLGTSIDDAIGILGPPLKAVKRDRGDRSCPACVAYCFMGEPPRWVVGFQEAWLIADQQGRIVEVFIHSEP